MKRGAYQTRIHGVLGIRLVHLQLAGVRKCCIVQKDVQS